MVDLSPRTPPYIIPSCPTLLPYFRHDPACSFLFVWELREPMIPLSRIYLHIHTYTLLHAHILYSHTRPSTFTPSPHASPRGRYRFLCSTSYTTFHVEVIPRNRNGRRLHLHHHAWLVGHGRRGEFVTPHPPPPFCHHRSSDCFTPRSSIMMPALFSFPFFSFFQRVCIRHARPFRTHVRIHPRYRRRQISFTVFDFFLCSVSCLFLY